MSLDVSLRVQTCECCGSSTEVYEANITHNLGAMARAAGIYEILWRPDECADVTWAGDIVERLSAGIAELDANQGKYEEFNAENGWGTYRQFVPWLEAYRDACVKWSGAVIAVSR